MGSTLSKVYIKNTKNCGKGVFARRNIGKGELILKRGGKIIKVSPSAYIQGHWFPIGKNKYLLSEPPAKYLNHSCNPNAGIKGTKDLVAMRDIKKGEEITYDYAMVGADDWTLKCRCGEPGCRKIIGRYKDLDRKIKQRYSKFVPKWVKDSR